MILVFFAFQSAPLVTRTCFAATMSQTPLLFSAGEVMRHLADVMRVAFHHPGVAVL